MRLLIKYGLCFILIPANFYSLYSQDEAEINSALTDAGFENVRVARSEDDLYVTIENNVFRWDVKAIAEGLDIISGKLVLSSELNLVLLEKGIPQLVVRVGSADWQNFRNGTLSPEIMPEKLAVTSETDSCMEILKVAEPANRDTWKFDLVACPQLYFQNTLKTQLYEIQFNIAPALEVTLLKGMKITGQAIFPICNELGYEGDFIRPGYLTLSQDFRLPGPWLGQFTAGNFDASRYGFDFYMKHPFRNENWMIEFNAGVTGNSHFIESRWIQSPVNKLTWSSSVSWFRTRFNLAVKAGIAQYIYNDLGIFGNCTRYFGETLVGFYAQAGKQDFNGGFYFSMPFPVKKRGRHKFFRFTIPEYYGLNYNAGTEFYYGQNFSPTIDKFQKKLYIFTQLYKSELLNLKKIPR